MTVTRPRRTESPDPRDSAAPSRRQEIFGLEVDLVDLDVAGRMVLEWVESDGAHVVVTPNTDHFLRWRRDADFRRVYDQADLVVLDGAPLVLIARLLGGHAVRVAGVDLFLRSVSAAADAGLPLIIIGGREGVAERAADRLIAAHPGLAVPLAVSPSFEQLQDRAWLQQLAAQLAQHPRKLVAVCLGSPKQEQLVADLRAVDPTLTGVLLCVGAAVDFAAGDLRRAPLLMQRAGLEWLFRLISEPQRLWRRYLVENPRILGYVARAALRRLGKGSATA